MAAIWDQGQGTKGVTESAEFYDRFMQYLELGPARTLAALSKILGVTPQNLGQIAKRFNWKKRAEAYDRSKGSKGKPRRVAPDSPQATKPPRIPPPPPPAATATAANPEVVGLVLSDGIAESHLEVLSQYQRTFSTLGHGMATEAQNLLPLVQGFREDLETARALWRQLLDQQEIERANVMARMLWDLIPAYYRICESMHGLANGARTHWGDAIGVHRVLEDAFKVRQQGQPQRGSR